MKMKMKLIEIIAPDEKTRGIIAQVIDQDDVAKELEWLRARWEKLKRVTRGRKSNLQLTPAIRKDIDKILKKHKLQEYFAGVFFGILTQGKAKAFYRLSCYPMILNDKEIAIVLTRGVTEKEVQRVFKEVTTTGATTTIGVPGFRMEYLEMADRMKVSKGKRGKSELDTQREWYVMNKNGMTPEEICDYFIEKDIHYDLDTIRKTLYRYRQFLKAFRM